MRRVKNCIDETKSPTRKPDVRAPKFILGFIVQSTRLRRRALLKRFERGWSRWRCFRKRFRRSRKTSREIATSLRTQHGSFFLLSG